MRRKRKRMKRRRRKNRREKRRRSKPEPSAFSEGRSLPPFQIFPRLLLKSLLL